MTSDSGSEDAIPARGSTSVGVIDKVRQLVMNAGVSLRAIPRVIELFVSPNDPEASIPSASGARWWLPLNWRKRRNAREFRDKS